MPRSIQEILDHADELAARFEDYEPADGDERSVEEYVLERATLDRARSERQVVEAVAAARSKGMSWTRIGAVLGTSARPRNSDTARSSSPPDTDHPVRRAIVRRDPALLGAPYRHSRRCAPVLSLLCWS